LKLKTVTMKQIFRVVRGGSRAVLALCSDGSYYICKCPDNRQGRFVLGAEYLYTVFGQKLGANVPNIAAVTVPATLLARDLTPTNIYDGKYKPSEEEGVGSWFGSEVPVTDPIRGNGIYDYVPLTSKIKDPAGFGTIIALDSWTHQDDSRQVIYWSGPGSFSAINWQAIDHGYSIFSRLSQMASMADDWQCPRGSLTYYLPKAFMSDESRAEALQACKRIRAFTPAYITKSFASVPPNWRPPTYDFDMSEKALIKRRLSPKLPLSALALLDDEEARAECRGEAVVARNPYRNPAGTAGAPDGPDAPLTRPRLFSGPSRGPTKGLIPGGRLIEWQR
jgi:hypothetical protein